MGQVVLLGIDGWVFMAIARGLWRDRLTDVVSTLDYLSRSLPMEAEFEASVRRLGRAGFIDVNSRGFKQTRRGGAMLRKFGLREGVIRITVDLMKEWDGLGVREANPDFRFELLPGEWERAVAAFEARTRRRIAKIHR